MAGRARAAAVPPEPAAAGRGVAAGRVLLPAAGVASREASRATFSRGRLKVARGYGLRAVGGFRRYCGRRAAKERRVEERAAEHGQVCSTAGSCCVP